MYYLLKYKHITYFPATWISSWLSWMLSMHTFPTQFLSIWISSNPTWNLFNNYFFSWCLEALAVYLIPQIFQDVIYIRDSILHLYKWFLNRKQFSNTDLWTEATWGYTSHKTYQILHMLMIKVTVAMAYCGKNKIQRDLDLINKNVTSKD